MQTSGNVQKLPQCTFVGTSCQNIRIQNLKNEAKRISKNTWVLYSKEESKIQITCLTEITKSSPYARKEWRQIPINGFKKVSLNQNCFGEFNEERLWAETTLESDNNVANYWLPRKNNFLENYPGIDEPTIMKALEKMPKELESQPFGELFKNADQIDFNVKMSDSLHTQLYHSIGLY